MIKKILIGLLVLLVVIQFIRPTKNISTGQNLQDIAVLFPMNDTVQNILKKACYDCHSNNTHYPWYYNIQPVAWWMQDHINEAKDELNFSEFGGYKKKKQNRKLGKVAKSVTEGWMPLDSYTWIHKDANLTKEENTIIVNWAKGLQQQIPIE
ncbi:MAG: heme-binding domain-containing protein [Bacteroidota bacterium]